MCLFGRGGWPWLGSVAAEDDWELTSSFMLPRLLAFLSVIRNAKRWAGHLLKPVVDLELRSLICFIDFLNAYFWPALDPRWKWGVGGLSSLLRESE